MDASKMPGATAALCDDEAASVSQLNLSRMTRPLHRDAYSTFIRNCPDMGATKMPFHRHMDK